MKDLIERIGNSIIHHGKYSNRIYLMSLDISDLPYIVDQLDRLAKKQDYTKIIVKIPSYAKELFISSGYREEAVVPFFYKGREDGYFLAKYLEENREINPFEEQCIQVISKAKQEQNLVGDIQLEKEFCCRIADESDIDNMIEVYKEVFETYPFPIFDKNYLAETMKDNVIYVGIWHKDKLIALSSMEMAKQYSNVEMTDFATRKEYRRKGYANYLLMEMEKIMRNLGIKTAYTIARATSFGMNITFSKNGYSYTGTLINNTNIAGQIESMNVWYKPLTL